jgi:cell division protein FtsB
MYNSQKEKTNFFSAKLFITIFGFLFLLYFIFVFSKLANKKYRISQDVVNLEAEITKLNEENLELEDMIQYLDSEQFVEEKARLSMGMRRPGEDVVVITNLDKEIDSLSDKKNEEVDKNNFIKWYKYFFQNK